MSVDQVSCGGLGTGSVSKDALAKSRLVANEAVDSLSAFAGNGDFFTRVVVLFKLVINGINEIIESRNDLELDFAENGAFEGFGEGFLDFAGASDLGVVRNGRKLCLLTREYKLRYHVLRKRSDLNGPLFDR